VRGIFEIKTVKNSKDNENKRLLRFGMMRIPLSREN